MNETKLTPCELCGQEVMEKDLLKHINAHFATEDTAPQISCDESGCFI